MQRTIFLFTFLFTSLISLVAQDKTVDALKLSETVYMLRSNSKIGNPTSVISVGKDGVLLIDSSVEDFGEPINNKIKELGGTNIIYLINTHTHYDHTKGNYNFGDDIIIIGKPETRKSFEEDENFAPEGTKDPSIGWPDITIDNEISLYFNGEQIRIIPLKYGHTYGDIIVYFTKSNVLVTGDYYFGEGYPVFYYPGGAEMNNYFDNIKYMLNEFPDDVKITPGHGTFEPKEIKYYTKQEYKTWYNNMLETIKIVKDKMNAGKTLEEMQKEGLPEKFEHYNEKPRFVSTDKWINAVYKFYSGEYKKEIK